MLLVGITGSIGMGKSTTASMFKPHNFAVYNADDTVHYIYENDESIINKIEESFPGAKENGKVNRMVLREELKKNPSRFRELESIIHPVTRQYQITYIKKMIENGHSGCILDIPLLFETGGDKYVDVTVVVTASKETQQRRVVKERSVPIDIFEKIISQQMPDEEKCKRADYVVSTNLSIDQTQKDVDQIISKISLLEPKAWDNYYSK
tara:strand:- start:4883 stop:5506 length:624 start_codon:yes stop_codon:yes gene_type:complete